MYDSSLMLLTEAQLDARYRIAMRILLSADALPSSLDFASRLKARVEGERIVRATARGLAEREASR